MSAGAVERLLAGLHAERQLRERFLRDPMGVCAQFGLDPDEATSVAAIDRVGLELAVQSLERKRARGPVCRPRGLVERWRSIFRRWGPGA